MSGGERLNDENRLTGVVDGLAKVGSGSLLHLLDNETSDLGRGILLADGLDPSVTVV